jgi:hypothetical protein
MLDEGEDGGRGGFDDIDEGLEIACIHRHPREEVVSATRQPYFANEAAWAHRILLRKVPAIDDLVDKLLR